MATFPPRCFTCGKPMAWEPYAKKLSEGIPKDEALDMLRFYRMCCRRMFLSHVPELEEDIMLYGKRR